VSILLAQDDQPSRFPGRRYAAMAGVEGLHDGHRDIRADEMQRFDRMASGVVVEGTSGRVQQ
jgi:hypothetical protein